MHQLCFASIGDGNMTTQMTATLKASWCPAQVRYQIDLRWQNNDYQTNQLRAKALLSEGSQEA
jgi:hypothetical protein